MADIYIVRHGQASFGTDDYDQLSPIGYRQGELLGRYFVKCGLRFDRLYAGTLKRQVQTAEAVQQVYRENNLSVPDIASDARWNELQTDEQVITLAPFVMPEGDDVAVMLAAAMQDKKAFQKLVRATFGYWIDHPDLVAELESWDAAQQRVLAALAEVQANNRSGQKSAVFTSGGIISIVTAHALSLPPSSVYAIFEKVINCSITRLLHNRHELALSTFNEHAFLSAIAPAGEEAQVITYR